MKELDRRKLWTEELYLESDKDILPLNVGGFLVGITAELTTTHTRPLEYITCELYLSGGKVRTGLLIDKFLIPVGWGYIKGGCLLERPLQNFNSAHPYVIKVTEHPRMKFTQIICWDMG